MLHSVTSKTLLLVAVSLFGNASCYAQYENPESKSTVKLENLRNKKFEIYTAPGTLLAGAAATWNSGPDIRAVRNRYIPDFRYRYDDYLQYAPAGLVFGLNAMGIKGKHTLERNLVSYVLSAAIMAVTVNSIKYSFQTERPDGSARNSFPSGHTANAFMGATLLHKEFGQYRSPLYSIGGYSVASATAISRQLNNKHWISDVLAGAGIGILSTELGYLLTNRLYRDKGTHLELNCDERLASDKPSFIEMKIGYPQAVADRLLGKADQGATKSGFSVGLQGAWFFSRHVGLGAEYAFSSFPVYKDQLYYDRQGLHLAAENLKIQPMGVSYIHAGIHLSIPVLKSWSVKGKIAAGVSLGTSGNIILLSNGPRTSENGIAQTPYGRYRIENAPSWSTGIGVQRSVGRNLGLKVYADYFSSDHVLSLSNHAASSQPLNNRYVHVDHIRFDHIVTGVGLTAIFR